MEGFGEEQQKSLKHITDSLVAGIGGGHEATCINPEYHTAALCKSEFPIQDMASWDDFASKSHTGEFSCLAAHPITLGALLKHRNVSVRSAAGTAFPRQ